MNGGKWVSLAVTALLVIAADTSQRGIGRDVAAQAAKLPEPVPTFQVDPSWPKLPNSWVMGQVASVAVDKHDNVWILHRPNTVAEAQRSHAAPPIVELDSTGKFVNAWGGPGEGYEWPDSEHGITVDYKDNVWIGGGSPISASLTCRSDDMLLKFTNKGKFIMQIGKRDASTGNADTKNVRQAADVYVYPKTNEAFVADGYTNRRVIVFDADTGAFKRMWGGTGSVPKEAPPVQSANAACRPPAPPNAAGGGRGRGAAAPIADDDPGPEQFGSPVHSSIVSNDGLVYVADRANRRVQVFTIDGKYVAQLFINRNAGGGPGAAALSPDKDQRFLYVGDQNAHHMLVIDRKTLKVLYQFGVQGPEPGNFRAVHHMAVDSKGNLYTAEVNPGNRAQRFVFKGMSDTLPANALTAEQLLPPPAAGRGRE
jgi:hypothetical protein